MSPGTRACIAYVAGRVVSGATTSYLYDHTEARRLNIGGTVRGDRVGLYDYDRKCSFSGSLPYLFDDGTSAQVLLEISGAAFGGRDGASGKQYSGSVLGSLISLRDHISGQSFKYSLQGSSPAAPIRPTGP
jgi:hypothetical protein